MFVDTAKVELHAGKGGDGAVSFRHEIYIPKGGPDGGDGGRGGSIIFRADKDTNTLLDFRYDPILRAEDGKPGAGQRAAGRSGKDLIVEVPIGTVVYREDAKPLADLVHDGEEAVIARGGDGGFGNAHFKSSTRQTPRIAEVGEPGEEFTVLLELKLLADVGLVGLPNAGKSTFLSVVSNAKPEIANYPFTTITPNLGVATIDGQDLLIADIPGLIEGAAEGKGLGHAFLRHVDRTVVLLHLVDAYADDAGKSYKIIRDELAKYSNLKDRPEIVALTKTEGLDEEIIKMQMTSILKINPEAKIYAISASAHQGLTPLLRALKEEATNSPETDFSSSHSDQNDMRGVAGSETGFSSEFGAKTDFSSSHSNQDDMRGVAPLGGPPMCLPKAKQRGNLWRQDPEQNANSAPNELENPVSDPIPTITLSPKALKNAWQVTEDGDKFIVTGEKIEKFARRTDLNNYASINRLRDIMKKMGIRAELTSRGAKDDSIISIAGKEFTLTEDY